MKQEAEQYGNVDEVQLLQQQIDDLEARATELERRRSQSIRGISWINQRNRQAIKEAILSGQIHVETSSQDDPFTRKNARMKPVPGRDKITQQFNKKKDAVTSNNGEHSSLSFQSTVVELNDQKLSSQKQSNNASGTQGPSGPVSDLFNAHNFDVDIDIAIPAAMTLSSSTPSLSSMDVSSRHPGLSNNRSTMNRGSSRPLSLEDYKRRKNLFGGVCRDALEVFVVLSGAKFSQVNNLSSKPPILLLIIHKISRKGTTILWQTTLGIELSEFSPRNMKKRPTWEPAKRINAQVPLVVEAYEKEKQKAASNGEPTGTSAESLEATAKCNAESPKRTRHSVTLPARKIKVVGVVRDNGRNVENSTLLVENESSGEQWCMQYEDIKREYSIELIEFFEGCISGFTNEVTFTNLTEAACICMESSGNAHMIKAYEARLDSDYGVF
ncbi:Rna polymerase-associated protein rtf1-like protein [Dirofilaria immitis]|nr:Rna polymerase-associated protein rtf1-like protein [Dirofilaria immitis]